MNQIEYEIPMAEVAEIIGSHVIATAATKATECRVQFVVDVDGVLHCVVVPNEPIDDMPDAANESAQPE